LQIIPGYCPTKERPDMCMCIHRCDRILWYGTGLRQLKYTCGKAKAKLSDHRSVTATFMAEVEMISQRKLKKACTFTKNAKVEVEELMPRITPIVDVCVVKDKEVCSSHIL